MLYSAVVSEADQKDVTGWLHMKLEKVIFTLFLSTQVFNKALSIYVTFIHIFN